MKEIKDFPGYFVTEDGRVYSTKYNKLKELTKQENQGYYAIYLEKDKKQYRKSIHRLVAETYIQNPNNLPQVNHIDEDKKNNHISNLEWVTQQQNIIHSNCRWIYRIENIKTGDIIETINLNQFAKDNYIKRGALSMTLSGKRKHHRNFRVISKIQFK